MMRQRWSAVRPATLVLPLWLGALAVSAGAGAGCWREQYRAALNTGDTVSLVRAIKGNDLVVRKGDAQARIRLVGAYAFDPNVFEKNDLIVWARNAAEHSTHQAEGRPLEVTLELLTLDPRGRHLGFIAVDGVDLGRLLIERGLAAVYSEYPFSREADYLEVERAAREAARGVWGDAAARERLAALRETWAVARLRRHGARPNDPLLSAGGP